MSRTPSSPTSGGTRRQFNLRSLLLATVWLAMILAICVHYQRAAARQRQALESLGLGGGRPARIGWQGTPPAPAKP